MIFLQALAYSVRHTPVMCSLSGISGEKALHLNRGLWVDTGTKGLREERGTPGSTLTPSP